MDAERQEDEDQEEHRTVRYVLSTTSLKQAQAHLVGLLRDPNVSVVVCGRGEKHRKLLDRLARSAVGRGESVLSLPNQAEEGDATRRHELIVRVVPDAAFAFFVPSGPSKS